MSNLPNCPECNSEYCYEDGDMLVCPECGHEWSKNGAEVDEPIVKDMNGNVLIDGDFITVTKDLKIKGSSSVVKVGTKVKIKLIDPTQNADHDIECKISGLGGIKLKSKHVKKA